jgi:hypothetical protein
VALEKELEAYGACDPVKVEVKKRAITLAHEAAVRWTGQYCALGEGVAEVDTRWQTTTRSSLRILHGRTGSRFKRFDGSWRLGKTMKISIEWMS